MAPQRGIINIAIKNIKKNNTIPCGPLLLLKFLCGLGCPLADVLRPLYGCQ